MDNLTPYQLQLIFCTLLRLTMYETVSRAWNSGVDVRLEIAGIIVAVPHSYQIHARLCFGNGYKVSWAKVMPMPTAFSFWWEQGWLEWAQFVGEQALIWRGQRLVMWRDVARRDNEN